MRSLKHIAQEVKNKHLSSAEDEIAELAEERLDAVAETGVSVSVSCSIDRGRPKLFVEAKIQGGRRKSVVEREIESLTDGVPVEITFV